jgi:hypothetical protein
MRDCSLAYHEDTTWLLDLEAEGCKIYRSKHCGVRVFPEQTRQQERVATDTELDWGRRLNSLQSRLNSLQKGAGARYVGLVAGRRLARSGDPDGGPGFQGVLAHEPSHVRGGTRLCRPRPCDPKGRETEGGSN